MQDADIIKRINQATGYTPTGTGNPTSPLYATTSQQMPMGYATSADANAANGIYPSAPQAYVPPDYSGAINSTFAAVQPNWGALYGDLDRNKAFNEGQIDNTYASNRSGIDLSNAQGVENLNRSEGGVEYTKSNSLRELNKNLGAAMNSRLNAIGSKGSGSSSAGYGLALALHGVENDQRSGMIDEANQQFGDINQSRKHLEEQHGQAVKQLDDWKAGEIAKIANDYLNEKGRIQRDQAGADSSKQAALAANSLQLAQNAAASLSQIQATHAAAIGSLSANTAGGTAIGNQFSPTLAGTNYKVQAIDGANPTIQYSGPTSPASMSAFSPLLYKSKEQTAN